MSITQVLVVEDSQPMLRTLSRALCKYGYLVIGAETGHAGLARCAQMVPDVAIVDIMLPDIPGWEVCRTIKAQYHIPVILMTGKARFELAPPLDRLEDAFLQKPFELEVLFTLLDNILTQQLPAKERAYGEPDD